MLIFFKENRHINFFSEAHPGSLSKANIRQEIYNIYTGRILQAFKGYTTLTLNYSHHLQSYLHYLHSENDDESDNYSLKILYISQ